MINVTSAQLDVWLATLMFPLVRLLALIATAPLLGNKQVPTRVKVGLALFLAIIIAPTLNPMPAVPVGSPQGLLIVVQQIIIGSAMGMMVRLIFAAVELAGEFSGMQMGLGFASFYDPINAVNSPVIAQWLGIVASLAFLAMNGHLMMLEVVAQSFHTLPVGQMISGKSLYSLTLWGASIFSFGLQISLPLLAALLITNLALGILTRAAQQLNLFAIGFPITLTVGFIVLTLTMPFFPTIFDRLTIETMSSLIKLIQAP